MYVNTKLNFENHPRYFYKSNRNVYNSKASRPKKIQTVSIDDKQRVRCAKTVC